MKICPLPLRRNLFVFVLQHSKEHYKLNEPEASLPLGIFEAQPLGNKRIISLNFQIEADELASIVITGGTWAFKDRFDEYGVPGAKMGEADENQRYIRVLRSVDVSEQAQQERILNIVGDKVLKNLAVRVTIDKKPEEDTAVAAFIEKLKETPSLHFVPFRIV